LESGFRDPKVFLESKQKRGRKKRVKIMIVSAEPEGPP